MAHKILAVNDLIEAVKVALRYAQLAGCGQFSPPSPCSNAELCEILGNALAKANATTNSTTETAQEVVDRLIAETVNLAAKLDEKRVELQKAMEYLASL